jgi:hypothetical protein
MPIETSGSLAGAAGAADDEEAAPDDAEAIDESNGEHGEDHPHHHTGYRHLI